MRETSLLWGLFYVHYVSGDLRGAEQYCITGQEVCRLHGINNMLAWHQYFEALLHLQRGQYDAAIVLLEKAVTQKYYQYTRAAVDAQIALTLAYQADGQSEQAAATLRTLGEFVNYLGPAFSVLADSCAARLALMQNRPESAIRWLETSPADSPEMMICWLEIPAVTRCRVMIAQGSSARLTEAEQQLGKYAEFNQACHNTCQLIGILALRALALQKLGQEKAALTVLQEAVVLAEAGGWIYPFVELGQPMAKLLERLAVQTGVTDYAHLVLDKFTTHNALPASAAAGQPRSISGSATWLVEPLTKRELDIPKLLAQRLQNKEIAAHLFVSPETIKSHLKNLYQKLGVNNRREAALKAADIISSKHDKLPSTAWSDDGQTSSSA